ncbi:hypothetical protein P4O66_008955 [Electrophorus voltai]|uniref:Uncharacterized protein n=1 Tax=Electrophorus voltai TaxID=2609070 RepID=A0AAD8ZB79_9TELE|nr:hypothetical protein P4O66_008955 [Electrophorus voltai]
MYFTKKMRERGTIALYALVICYCSVTKGDHGGSTTHTPPPPPSSSTSATSSSPLSSSTSQLESFVNATAVHLNVSSEADGSSAGVLNSSLAQDGGDTRNNTIEATTGAPGPCQTLFNTASPHTEVKDWGYFLTASSCGLNWHEKYDGQKAHVPRLCEISVSGRDVCVGSGYLSLREISVSAAPRTTNDSTRVPLNTTESPDIPLPSAGDNQTVSSPPPSTVMVRTIFPTTRAARGQPQSSTSLSTMESHPPTGPRSTTASRNKVTTSPETTTAQMWHKALTVSAKHTTSLTTTTTTTQNTEASKLHVSTPVQAKASELNVGDDESSTSLDPLLAGLVSVFVVTTAIISLLIFLKFRHQNERPEFRRLQDLPMDDMMEDTPLSMYSY